MLNIDNRISPLKETWVAIDTETTGLSEDKDSIIEVGCVKFVGDRHVETYKSLVNPLSILSDFTINFTGITQNDAFKPVTKYFDRLTRPEQILQTLPQAIQTMLDPADCGPACISMSQDVQGEVFEYPEDFFKEIVHNIRRPRPDDFQIKQAAEKIKSSKNPIIISGGGVFYSDAMEDIANFAEKHNIPVTQTVM